MFELFARARITSVTTCQSSNWSNVTSGTISFLNQLHQNQTSWLEPTAVDSVALNWWLIKASSQCTSTHTLTHTYSHTHTNTPTPTHTHTHTHIKTHRHTTHRDTDIYTHTHTQCLWVYVLSTHNCKCMKSTRWSLFVKGTSIID